MTASTLQELEVLKFFPEQKNPLRMERARTRLALMARLFGLVAVVVLSSCGFVGGRSARCDLRPKTPQCTDWRNNLQPVWTVQESLCTTLGGTGAGGTFTASQTCPTADMWGGCQVRAADGSLQTNWYYTSDKYKTKEAAKAECESAMTFVDPS